MWSKPVDLRLVATADPESYRSMPWWPEMTTGVPVLSGVYPGNESNRGHDGKIWNTSSNWYEHPGAFGAKRKHGVHTGVDLYVPEGTLVTPVEDGVVVRIGQFTGTAVGSPWWNDTFYVMVEGESGVVCYGELRDIHNIYVMDVVTAGVGDRIGHVSTVLKKGKGRPTSMLHLELYERGYRGEPVDWPLDTERPLALRDPTPYLLELCR